MKNLTATAADTSQKPQTQTPNANNANMRIRAKIHLTALDRETLEPETLWTTLRTPIWADGAYSSRYAIRTGEFLLAIWYQPRAGRWVVKTGSIWEDRNNPGCTLGDRYEQRTAEDILSLIEAVGLDFELGELLPILREEVQR